MASECASKSSVVSIIAWTSPPRHHGKLDIHLALQLHTFPSLGTPWPTGIVVSGKMASLECFWAPAAQVVCPVIPVARPTSRMQRRARKTSNKIQPDCFSPTHRTSNSIKKKTK